MSSLGRVVQHDPRSLNFRTRHAGAPIIYADHRRYGEALDQDLPVPLGSCTGNAGAGILNTHGFVANSHLMDETDAVNFYSLATNIDGFGQPFPPNDRGSSGLAVAKVLKTLGYISRYEHAFSLNDALAGLGRGPGMLGINWYDSFDRPGANGLIEFTSNASVRGGHEIELTAVFPEHQLVKFWNSWGRGWANKGTGMMSFATLERLLGEQGDVVFPIK